MNVQNRGVAAVTRNEAHRFVTKCKLKTQSSPLPGWEKTLPNTHRVSFNSSFYTTRDGSTSLSLNPNCWWSELCLADAEWRLDKRNHPDSRGWSGRCLAAALALQLGPQHPMPLGVKLDTGHRWLDQYGLIQAQWWGAGLVKKWGWGGIKARIQEAVRDGGGVRAVCPIMGDRISRWEIERGAGDDEDVM